MSNIDEIFNSAIKPRVFKKREVLLPDYVPEILPHRDEEIKKVALTLSPSLRFERPSNIFIYGLTGTGKTAVTKYVLRKLEENAKEKGIRVGYIYSNVRHRETPYRILADIAEYFNMRIPFTGLSTGEVYNRIVKKMSNIEGIFIIVLDEIDFLVKKYGDDLLYNLTRINEQLVRSKVSIIGITNSVKMIESLDPRVKSSLSEEEIVFPPYDAQQLQDILYPRAKDAFVENALDEDVVPQCSALAAREHGDARRALDLLRIAGEIAERNNRNRVTNEEVMKARLEIERDRVSDVVKTLPLHGKLVMASILVGTSLGKTYVTTGEIYEYYKKLVTSLGLEEVTLRRISSIISELDMLGIITGRIISRGRYGKTRVISLAADTNAILQALKEDPMLGDVINEAYKDANGKNNSM
ncbi:MAG: Cdc6/Cdc18 family protein [Caldisphaera sp.]|jgi:cell division control protein 6|nr:MAG: cell division control protein Cdc6 [Caldisphaera sp.]PMP92097.1 MAG: cell division control protein Cdc6 [Caldisphaera sp.]